MNRQASSRAEVGAVPDGNELLIGVEVPDAQKEPGHLKQSPRQDHASARKFALHLAIFLAPILLFAAVIELFLWHMGESWSLDRVIQFQEHHPRSYFSRGLLDQGTFRYKYIQLVRRHPSIITLGSSRVMQFRAEMFGSQGASFYNGGGLIHAVEDLNQFFDRLPKSDWPKVVILGVDFWWLNGDFKNEQFDAFDVGVREDGTYSWEGHATAVSSFVRHPSSLRDLVLFNFAPRYSADAIGERAQLNHSGFRLDGSKRFEFKIPKTKEGWEKRVPGGKHDQKRIEEGVLRHFAYTEGVSLPLLEKLRAVLARLKENGVFIIVYNPPVVSGWDRIVSNAPKQKQFWKEYHEKLPELCRSLDIPFWDIVTPATIGLGDRYMRDPYHAHETFDVYLLQRFCEDERVRKLFPEVPKIAEEALASPRTNPLYPDIPGDQSPSSGK